MNKSLGSFTNEDKNKAGFTERIHVRDRSDTAGTVATI